MTKNLQLHRVMMEIFGGCNYTCKCVLSQDLEEERFYKKNALKNLLRSAR